MLRRAVGTQHLPLSRSRRAPALVLAVLALALFALPAYAADGGTIQGKVVNATTNGSSVEGVEVTLTAYFGQTERNKSTATTDKDGNFQFTGLDTSSNYSYEATTTYQKGDYTADRVSFSNPGETKQVTLKVYDSTQDDSTVKATAKHYVLTPTKNGTLEVQEILALNNGTDKSYIGSKEVGPDQRETSRYLPVSGAKNIQYGDTLMSCCVVNQGAGFVDTMAITPGQTEKDFSYELPYSGTTLSFTATLQQPTDTVQMLVPVGVRATISGLANHGTTQNVQNATYQVFSAQNVPVNTNFEVQLEGLPESVPVSPFIIAGVVVAVLAALAAAFYVLRKRSGRAPAASYSYATLTSAPKRGKQRGAAGIARGVASGNPAVLELEKSELLNAMANLDDWFETGRISRQDYERLRAEKKQRLMALMQHQAGRKGTPAKV